MSECSDPLLVTVSYFSPKFLHLQAGTFGHGVYYCLVCKWKTILWAVNGMQEDAQIGKFFWDGTSSRALFERRV